MECANYALKINIKVERNKVKNWFNGAINIVNRPIRYIFTNVFGQQDMCCIDYEA